MNIRRRFSFIPKIVAVSICAALFLVGTQAIADGPALDIEFTTGGQDLNNGSFSLGWNFTVNSQVTVTALGFYSANKGALSSSHDVGIYDAGCNLVATTTVQPSDTLRGYFRYHNLPAPVVLSPGQTYSIAAVTGGAPYLYNPNAVVLDPAVNFGKFTAWQAALQQTAVLQCPNFPSSTQFYGDFGPTFYIGTQSGGGSDKRASATKIFCNRSGDLQTATCTVTVGDQGAQPRINPTGDVQFTTTEGSLAGANCMLQGVSLSPGISSCKMDYFPPAGFPIGKAFPVTATYVGDTNFDPSSTSHELIYASCVGTPAKPCPNSIGLGFGDLPAIINKVVSMLATCGSGEEAKSASAFRSYELRDLGFPNPPGGTCNIISGLGLDIDKFLEEATQDDLSQLYDAFARGVNGNQKEAIFEYADFASKFQHDLYVLMQDDAAFRKEIYTIIEKNALGRDYGKIFSKYQLRFARSSKPKTPKKAKESLLKFATVERVVKSNKTAMIKFKLNKRAQKLMAIFKSAGIATVPLKTTMVATQQKRYGKAKFSQSVNVLLR